MKHTIHTAAGKVTINPTGNDSVSVTFKTAPWPEFTILLTANQASLFAQAFDLAATEAEALLTPN